MRKKLCKLGNAVIMNIGRGLETEKFFGMLYQAGILV